MRPLRDLLLNGRDHFWWTMAKNNGPVAVPIVDQFMTVNVPFAGTAGMSDINGKRLEAARIMRYAIGKERTCAFKMPFRSGECGLKSILKRASRQCRSHAGPPP